MKIQFFGAELLWVVFFIAVCWGFALNPVVSAFAEAGSGAGAISGGFFAANALLAGMPETPGAMSAGAAPRAGNGPCDKAVAAASAGHQPPPGL
jgi:hypothetical protein